MGYQWTEGWAENGAITVSRTVDNGFNPQAQKINGGLDRENLSPSSIDRTMVLPLAVAKYSGLEEQANAIFSMQNPVNAWNTGNDRGNDQLVGISFADMQGGQANIVAATAFADCDEGMLSICWTAKAWINTYKLFFPPNPPGPPPAVGLDYSLKSVSFFIRVDGATVAQTRAYYKTFENIKCETSIPISKGNHTVEILYKFASMTVEDDRTEPMLHWWGGNLSCINRLR